MISVLNMCSVKRRDDRTAAARIRDAAIELFGRMGFDKATVRDIADSAGVSPALVLHHYGSKAGLREACDEWVVEEFARARTEMIESGTSNNPFAAMAAIQAEEVRMGYLLRSLREGTPAAGRLFDGLVEHSLRLMEWGVEAGELRQSRDLRDQAVLLVAWQFGGLLLQNDVARAFGTELNSREMKARYIRAALEVMTHGVFSDSRYEDAWSDLETSGEPPPTPAKDASRRGSSKA